MNGPATFGPNGATTGMRGFDSGWRCHPARPSGIEPGNRAAYYGRNMDVCPGLHTRRSTMNAKRTGAVALLLGLSLGVCFVAGCGLDREPNAGQASAAEGAPAPVPAPEFTGVTDWIN